MRRTNRCAAMTKLKRNAADGLFTRPSKFIASIDLIREGYFMENGIRERIFEMKDWLVQIRRTIHMHPELMYEEEKTALLVGEWLENFGMEVKKGVAKTGVVGLLRGAKEGKTVAIRADMDALPIEEANPVPYASKIKGKMHACGHDAHTAILLGVAKFFSSMRDQLHGNIKWIFQPAEEGGAGGKLMTEEGVLENPGSMPSSAPMSSRISPPEKSASTSGRGWRLPTG